METAIGNWVSSQTFSKYNISTCVKVDSRTLTLLAVMMEATIGAAVFLEDKSLYEWAMSIFAARVPAYIYLTEDGPYPIPGSGIANNSAAISKYWYNQALFNTSGITQETCRDLAHPSYGISSISHISETARIQGNDLWKTSVGTRIQAALEFHAPFLLGAPVPKWLCGGTLARHFDPSNFSSISIPNSFTEPRL